MAPSLWLLVTVELLYVGLLYVGHSSVRDSLPWNGKTYYCMFCVCAQLLYVGPSSIWDSWAGIEGVPFIGVRLAFSSRSC